MYVCMYVCLFVYNCMFICICINLKYNFIIYIHYGVVGNIQASHVCAPGSIPGDGVFLKRKHKSLAHIEEIEKDIRKRGGAVVARQAHNLQVG